MSNHSELIDATKNIDLERIKRCLTENPESIHDVDRDNNNAMHLCVAGFASIRAPHLMEFFLNETDIDLLHKNDDNLDPLELAMTLNDKKACAMLEPYCVDQLVKRYPLEEDHPTVVKRTVSKPNDPSGGPS